MAIQDTNLDSLIINDTTEDKLTSLIIEPNQIYVTEDGTGGIILYDTTGQNTDGVMTQKAVSDEISSFATKFALSQKVTLDATMLDQNTWYPVKITGANGLRWHTMIRVWNDWDGGTPDWSTHESKNWSCDYLIFRNGEVWGEQSSNSIVLTASANWVNSDTRPVCGLGSHSPMSFMYFYIRGGAKYNIYNYGSQMNFELLTESYTTTSGYELTLSPTTVAPYEIKVTFSTTSHNHSQVDSAKILSGFAYATSSQGWGNQIGTFVCGAEDPNGGAYAFRRDNPHNNQLSLILDGTVYVNEGSDRVLTLDLVYPVGSIYISVNDVSPASFVGGNWEKLAGGYALLTTTEGNDVSTANAKNHLAGQSFQGGLPNIYGYYKGVFRNDGYTAPFYVDYDGSISGVHDYEDSGGWGHAATVYFDANSYNDRYGTYQTDGATVVPDHIAVFAWKRIP